MNQTTLNKFFGLPKEEEEKEEEEEEEKILKKINNFKYDRAHKYNNNAEWGEIGHCDSSNLEQEREITEYIHFSNNKEFKNLMLEKLNKYTSRYGPNRFYHSPLITDIEKKKNGKKIF